VPRFSTVPPNRQTISSPRDSLIRGGGHGDFVAANELWLIPGDATAIERLSRKEGSQIAGGKLVHSASQNGTRTADSPVAALAAWVDCGMEPRDHNSTCDCGRRAGAVAQCGLVVGLGRHPRRGGPPARGTERLHERPERQHIGKMRLPRRSSQRKRGLWSLSWL
jgi:hypothetical protein